MIGRYFRYELKKNLKTLGLLTAICTIIYVVVTSTAALFYTYGTGAVYVPGHKQLPYHRYKRELFMCRDIRTTAAFVIILRRSVSSICF